MVSVGDMLPVVERELSDKALGAWARAEVSPGEMLLVVERESLDIDVAPVQEGADEGRHSSGGIVSTGGRMPRLLVDSLFGVLSITVYVSSSSDGNCIPPLIVGELPEIT